MLPGALGNQDDGVRAPFDTALQGSEETILAFELERHFGYEREVDFLAGNGCPGGDEPGVPSHDLDQRDAVMHAVRLGVCAGNELGRFLDRRQVTEGP